MHKFPQGYSVFSGEIAKKLTKLLLGLRLIL